jgi:sugar phosphate permease
MWLVRLVMASISPFYTIGMMVIMMELVSRENYGFAMGLYGLSEDLGGIVGSLVLGAMYDQYGFATCTYFMSFVCLVAVFMVWVNMHNHKKRLLQQP